MAENNKRTFYSRINNNRRAVMGRDGVSNCIGTALFLVGEQLTDDFVYGTIFYLNMDHTDYIESMEEVSEPKTGCLVAWENIGRNIIHLGVIVNENPVLVAHRDGSKGQFHKNMPLERVNEIYDCGNERIRYFIPPKLKEV